MSLRAPKGRGNPDLVVRSTTRSKKLQSSKLKVGGTMDYRSLFITSVRILRQNKKIWLFSLVISLNDVLFVWPKNLTVLYCFLLFIKYLLLIVGQLAILLTLYHSYLGQAINIKGLWTEINSYFIRVVGIIILCIVLFAIPGQLLYLIVRGLPYFFSETAVYIPVFFLWQFLHHLLPAGDDQKYAGLQICGRSLGKSLGCKTYNCYIIYSYGNSV